MKSKEIIFYGILGKRNNVTVPPEIIRKCVLKTQQSFVLLIEVKNTKFYSNVTYQNFSYSLYLPQFITKSLNLNSRDKIKIKIIGILKKKLNRSEISKLNLLINKPVSFEKQTLNNKEFIDMKKLLSGKIKIRDNTTFFITKDTSHGWLLVSYRYPKIARESKPIIIKRYIPLYSFAQFLGFYIGDGTTTPNTGSVSFINTARDVIEWNTTFMKTYFKCKLKYRLVYGPIEPDSEVSEKIRKFWSEIGISFNWSINRGYKNPNEFGAMRVETINMCLKLIILKALERVSNEATKNPVIAKFFLKGLAMSDMYPTIKHGILESINVAFKAGDKKLIKLYRQIFGVYGIKAKKNSKKIQNTTHLSTYRTEDFIKILIDGIFKFHKAREEKFVKGLLNMDLFSRYFKRLKLFLDGPLAASEFAKKSKLSDIPYGQLERLTKFDLLGKTITYPRLYFITDKGKELLNKLINSN